MIRSLQVGRGAAAIAVAIYHCYLILLQKTGVPIFGSVAQFGYLGVPFFFVLSGFIIALAHGRDIDQPSALCPYVMKRFLRVYPLYWLLSIFYIVAASTGLGDPDFSWNPVHLIEDVLLIHATPNFNSPPLKVAWTLFYEIRFYLFFGLAIMSRRLGILALVVWLAALVLVRPTSDFMIETLSYWNLAFVFGMIAHVLYRKLPARLWWPFLAVGIAMLLLSFSLAGPMELRDRRSVMIIPVSLGFASVMLGIAMLEGRAALKFGKLPMLLGDASYAIYLVHSAVISVAVAVYLKSGLDDLVPIPVAYFGILIVAIGAGVVAHWILEKPILAWGQRFKLPGGMRREPLPAV